MTKSKLTKQEQQVCAKYSARDEDGLVRCSECPLVIDNYSHACLANTDGRSTEAKALRRQREQMQCTRHAQGAWATHILRRFTIAQ